MFQALLHRFASNPCLRTIARPSTAIAWRQGGLPEGVTRHVGVPVHERPRGAVLPRPHVQRIERRYPEAIGASKRCNSRPMSAGGLACVACATPPRAPCTVRCFWMACLTSRSARIECVWPIKSASAPHGPASPCHLTWCGSCLPSERLLGARDGGWPRARRRAGVRHHPEASVVEREAAAAV